MSKAAIKRIRDEMESPYEGVMYENGKPRSGLWCRFRIEDVPFIAEALYASPRHAAADAGVREALDILDGLDADIGLLKTAVEADDPKRELKIRFGDIGATIRNLRSSLSLAAKREQAR